MKDQVDCHKLAKYAVCMKSHKYRDSLVGFADFKIRKRATSAAAAAYCRVSKREAKDLSALSSRYLGKRSVRDAQMQPRNFDISRQFLWQGKHVTQDQGRYGRKILKGQLRHALGARLVQ